MHSLYSIMFYFHILLPIASSDISRIHPDLLTNIEGCTQDIFCYSTHNQRNAYCNEFGICECKFGHSFGFDKFQKRMFCIPYKCTQKENNCSLYWGPDAICDLTVREESQTQMSYECICPGEQIYSQTDRKCIQPTTKKIGEKCDQMNGTNNCPWKAGCLAGECRCQVGYVPLNHYKCWQIDCKSDEACEKLYPNSKCKTGGCGCDDGFKLQHETECVRRLRQDDCRFSTDCGKGVVCQLNTCVCKQGFIENPHNLFECEQMNCTTDRICTERDQESYCDTGIGHCKCSYRTSNDGSHCSRAPGELKPLPVKKQETPGILYVVLYIGAGSIVILVAVFMIYRFYPQIERLKSQLSERF